MSFSLANNHLGLVTAKVVLLHFHVGAYTSGQIVTNVAILVVHSLPKLLTSLQNGHNLAICVSWPTAYGAKKLDSLPSS